MARHQRIRTQRLLKEAEGYLELRMPQQALETLQRIAEPRTYQGHLNYLRGEALRSLGRFHAALEPLEAAVEHAPSNLPAWVALAWCHKRTGRLDLAIETLQDALEIEPGEALLHYNLACYWSLAGKKRRALVHLHEALARDERYRDRLADEPDFDPIRSDPEFQALTTIIV